MEENSHFSKMAEEKLQMKMDQIKENREAYLAAMLERLQEKVRMAPVVLVTCTTANQSPPSWWLTSLAVWSSPGETCSRGAQEQRAEGRADRMSIAEVLTSIVHLRHFIQPPPVPALILSRTDTQTWSPRGGGSHHHTTPHHSTTIPQYYNTTILQYSPLSVFSVDTNISITSLRNWMDVLKM